MNYISLLRGINVSGQKKIKMAELKALYVAHGFDNVVTYIQGGNVIFESKGRQDRESIRKNIALFIQERYGFHVPVDIRTNKEFENIANNCPYEEAKEEGSGTKILYGYVRPPEKLTVLGREIYLYCPDGYGTSKLTNGFLEKKARHISNDKKLEKCQKTVRTSYALACRLVAPRVDPTI